MENAKIDENFNPTLIGVSSADGETPVRAEINPATGRLLVDATGGGGGGGDASADNQTNGDQKTQIVDAGGEAVTVTGGKLDVNASVDTTGLATSTKQDALLAELQLKADLTETQPVSLASVPSHPVTNAGTFAVQASGDVASAAADSGNPMKVGTKYNATQPTFTDGQRGEFQMDARGNQRVTPMFAGGVNAFAGMSDNGDGVATTSTTNRLTVVNRNTVFNGTTWDRMSGDTTGINVKAIVGSLPAGTNAIGKLSANSGVDIGDVDVISVTPGTGATSLGKAEDAAHTSGDTGVYALGVRQDADTSPVSADGDYHGLVFNAIGRLKTSVLPAATTATTGNITTNTSTVTVDTTRQSGVTMQITGTFVAFNGTFEGSIDGGTTWNAIQGVRSNSNTVELTTGLLSANPGYFWKISANNFTTVRIRATALTSGTVAVTFLPTAFSSDPAPAAQRTRRDLKTTQATTITSSTSETTVLTAVAATFLDVYGVIVANTSATAVDVTFKDATAGTTRFNVYVPAGETRGFMLPPDGAHPQTTVNNNWTATCGTSVASVKITMMAVKNT